MLSIYELRTFYVRFTYSNMGMLQKYYERASHHKRSFDAEIIVLNAEGTILKKMNVSCIVHI